MGGGMQGMGMGMGMGQPSGSDEAMGMGGASGNFKGRGPMQRPGMPGSAPGAMMPGGMGSGTMNPAYGAGMIPNDIMNRMSSSTAALMSGASGSRSTSL